MNDKPPARPTRMLEATLQTTAITTRNFDELKRLGCSE